MNNLLLTIVDEQLKLKKASHFCSLFCAENKRTKYIFGRNIYAEKILESVKIDGFIDDFTQDKFYLEKSIFRTEEIPADALVLIASGGMPLSAKKKLDELGIENLDYFSFYKYSGLVLTDVFFNEGFADEFKKNSSEYEWIYNLLYDEASRVIFKKLLSFRLKYDLEFLSGFTNREKEQYFEEFLELKSKNESFVDVGVFDAYTSLEFIKHCPDYQAIHLFEPDPDNYQVCLNNLQGLKNIHLYNMGLSNTRQVLKFALHGSGSKVSEQGSVDIHVDRLDDMLNEPVSFIKMDIEGSELPAIEGAKETILLNHPRLAISVYHNAGDFWQIPKKILDIRNDYQIYLRHYTESIYETVMFFIPVKK